MTQLLCAFPDRATFLAACPPAWLVDGEVQPPPEQACLVVHGRLYDEAEAGGAPVARPGYHVLALFPGAPLPAFAAAAVPRQPGDPIIPTQEPPPVILPPAAVPAEISRAQARIVMATHILDNGRSLLSATRDLLAQQLEATAGLPDADPQRIAAVQASEWWSAAASYRRDHPVLLQVAERLGVTPIETDALFRAAALIAA
ncbi:hypothetical protein [Pseudoroseomonas ludipueritiae]|uniref:Uncharacterized protein n=1 Tax=Pseudoroseomonas ludipueritiae TaxID=198093 RepID=A0ABR7R8F9_9PROT|nr:hypothetical protein [Pseudoroseomonas ludipueritiae]MBC9177842.1 hypothetical protein [Pseudoroseomonas ludipueritiae]MCG7363184.1 hypothetical protein [Roseomonas sp. ACRSG]